MNTNRPAPVLASALVLVTLSAAQAQPLCSNFSYACRQFIIKVEPNQSVEGVIGPYGGVVLRSISSRRTYLVEVPSQSAFQAAMGGLHGDPRIAWIEPNLVHRAPGGNTQSFFLNVAPPEFTAQYSGTLIGAAGAHQVSSGAGVLIAVLDTGLDAEHPALAGRIAQGGYNFVEDNGDIRDLGNGIDDDGDDLIDELTGHGTFVSSLALLVAPNANVIPFRVLNSDGAGTAFQIAQGIDAAVTSGAAVINLSLGSQQPSRCMEDAVQAALAQGRIIVAAVGNTNRQQPPQYPARFPGVLAVAGTDQFDLKADFSDYGGYVALSAPAVNMVGAMPGAQYGRGSGTSFAAPLISGTAALLQSVAPTAGCSTIMGHLGQTSTNINLLNTSYAGLLGAGRLNAAAALQTSMQTGCYANCDMSSSAPVLNVADFACFLQRFASGDPYANCDQSTAAPILNVSDFSCFLQSFAAGCR